MATQVEEWLQRAGATNLRMSGEGNVTSRCPFCDPGGAYHNCFAVNIENGLYLCYRPSCGAQGHIRSLLVDKLGYSPAQAAEAVEGMEAWKEADVDGLDIPSYADRNRVAKAPVDLEHEATIGLYKFTPTYMLKRGFSRKVLAEFEIGYDHETHRVTFPVRDAAGTLLGYSTRATRDYDFPKYLHLGFKKSSVLYGEHLRTGKETSLVVGEGNADALALREMMRHPNYLSVATLGARVSRVQIDAMFKYPRVLLCFDRSTDKAEDPEGERATFEVGSGLQARGHAAVHVLSFANYPMCKDPGDVLSRSVRTKRRAIPFRRKFDQWLEFYSSKKDKTC